MSLTEIDVFKIRKKLKQPFKTSSGILSEKDIILLVFKEDNMDTFIYELPFSPSMGEMPDSFINKLENNLSSSFLSNAISWYDFMKSGEKIYRSSVSERTKIITYGIDEINYDRGSLIRLKGSSANMSSVVNFSKSTNDKWMIDFNGSLNIEMLNRFIKEVDLKNCVAVEQPLAKEYSGRLNYNKNISFRADESVSLHKDISILKQIGYSSVVLKPLYYTAGELTRLLLDAEKLQVRTIVGSVSCDNIFLDFCKVVNQMCSIYIENLSDSSSMFLEPFLTENIYSIEDERIKINQEIFTELRTLFAPAMSIRPSDL